MYYCPACSAEFEKPMLTAETHGLDTPPYEIREVCPSCKRTGFYEKTTTHCRCCGAKLPDGTADYCSPACRAKGERLWERERRRRRLAFSSPVSQIVRELVRYNRENQTRYSYGQYVALIRPRLTKGKKR